MARSAARARFQGRSSAGWKTPPDPDPAQPPTGAPEPEAIDPSFSNIPIESDPELPPDVIRFKHPDYNGVITGLGDPIDSLSPSPLGGARATAFDVAAVQLAAIDEKAIDQLWDWVRADPEGVKHFIGFIPEHSRALFKWIDNFNTLASKGMAWNTAIYLAGQLIGFVMLYPITKSGVTVTGDCHIYIAKDVRGNIAALLPMLMAEADRVIPNVSLRVVTARDDEWVRLLRGVGFVTQIVLTRPAASTGTTNGI